MLEKCIFSYLPERVLIISFMPLRKVGRIQQGVKRSVEIDDIQISAGSEGMVFTSCLEVSSKLLGARGQSIHTREVI